MLPLNPAFQATAKRMRIATIVTILLIFTTVGFSVFAANTCNAVCTDLYYFYECHSNGDLYCCSSTYCSGSCYLKTSSCSALRVVAGICGFLLLVSIVAMFVFACKMKSMQREATQNGNMGIAPYSNGNLIYPNQQYPQYNNYPVIYGNNQPNQGNLYQQGNNYVAPQYYNNQQ